MAFLWADKYSQNFCYHRQQHIIIIMTTQWASINSLQQGNREKERKKNVKTKLIKNLLCPIKSQLLPQLEHRKSLKINDFNPLPFRLSLFGRSEIKGLARPTTHHNIYGNSEAIFRAEKSCDQLDQPQKYSICPDNLVSQMMRSLFVSLFLILLSPKTPSEWKVHTQQWMWSERRDERSWSHEKLQDLNELGIWKKTRVQTTFFSLCPSNGEKARNFY